MPSIFDFETLTVSTTAVPLTASKVASVAPSQNVKGGKSETSVLVSPVAYAIRFRFDGVAPTATVGHYLAAGDFITVDSYDRIAGLQMIRDTAAGGDAIVSVTYSLTY